MRRSTRPLILIPLIVLAVVVPTLLISFLVASNRVEGATIPTRVPATRTRVPVRTPTRVPPATATRTATPSATPTATPSRTPSATPTALPALLGRRTANGHLLEKVFANRLSTFLYGRTTNGRLYRSPNDGGTWRLASVRTPLIDFVFGPEDPGTLYAGSIDCGETESTGQLLRSTDGGADWLVLASDVPLAPLLVDPADSNALLASGCDGLYGSADGGFTWQQRSRTGENGIPDGYVLRTLAPAWYAQTGETMEPSLQVLYALADNEDGATLVLASEDAGATWIVITPYLNGTAFRIPALTVDAFAQGHVWFAGEAGVWQTLDDGLTWTFSIQGLDREDQPQSLLLHPSDRLYLGTASGLYARPATGTRWSLVAGQAMPSESVEEILFTDSRPGVLWLNAEDGVFNYVLR